MLLGSNSIQSASHAPTAAGSSATAIFIWKMACLTAKPVFFFYIILCVLPCRSQEIHFYYLLIRLE